MRVAALLLSAVMAVTLEACANEEDPNLAEVAPADFPAWSTMSRLAEAGTISVGIIGDRLDDDGAPVGFEVEVAKMVAGALGIPAHDITWVQTEPAHRERLVEDGYVDVVVAAFPWGGTSLEIVDFAGPYHVGYPALLVEAGVSDLERATVCVADGTPASPDSPSVLPDDVELVTGGYAECVEQLRRSEVDAVSGADLVLAGHVDNRWVLADGPGGEQPYGIALAKGDDELRAFVNNVLATAFADGRWAAAWEATLGAVLGPADPPQLVRY